MAGTARLDADTLDAAAARLMQAEKVLCDIDGCLIAGGGLLPGAAEFAGRFSSRLVLVSNNSTDTPAGLAARLRAMGIEVAAQQIVLAGELALQFIRCRFGPARIFALASSQIGERARQLGLQLDDSAPEVVLICRDTGLSLPRLETALRHFAAKVPVVVANSDITHPGTSGPALETGAIFAMLSQCVAPGEVHHIGKPAAALFRQALGQTAPGRAVMIGDNPDTDGAGARAMGIPAILFTGRDGVADMQALMQQQRRSGR
jgi:HAD superfamily hydrolase (TIGR01450 family)